MGYGAFPLDMVQYIWRAKQPYNVSVAAEVAACAALTNMDYLNKVRAGMGLLRLCISSIHARLDLAHLLNNMDYLNKVGATRRGTRGSGACVCWLETAPTRTTVCSVGGAHGVVWCGEGFCNKGQHGWHPLGEPPWRRSWGAMGMG